MKEEEAQYGRERGRRKELKRRCMGQGQWGFLRALVSRNERPEVRGNLPGAGLVLQQRVCLPRAPKGTADVSVLRPSAYLEAEVDVLTSAGVICSACPVPVPPQGPAHLLSLFTTPFPPLFHPRQLVTVGANTLTDTLAVGVILVLSGDLRSPQRYPTPSVWDTHGAAGVQVELELLLGAAPCCWGLLPAAGGCSPLWCFPGSTSALAGAPGATFPLRACTAVVEFGHPHLELGADR